MALNRQQKILAGVIALGAAAVAIDRVVVGYDATGPSDAAAHVAVASEAAVAPPSLTPQAGTVVVQRTAQPRSALAHRLSRLGASQSFASADLVDAFKASEDWFVPIEREKPSVPALPPPDWRAMFLERHQLGAVVGNGSDAVAVVNERTLRIGQSISLSAQQADQTLHETATLVAVDDRARSATFLVGSERVVLSLASPQLSGDQRISVSNPSEPIKSE